VRALLTILAAALLWATCGGDDVRDPDEPTGVECVWDQGEWDRCDWQ
jgi:hypothetical protein